jgi:AcrR family transcriptional regulator
MATEELGRRERKRLQTREAIEASALALFAERGFEATTLAQVARAAGLALSTVTHHFATKAGLGAALFRHQCRGLLAAHEASEVVDVGERLRGLLGDLATMAARYADHASTYLVEAATHDPRHDDDPVTGAVADLVTDLRERGEVGSALADHELADLLVVSTVSRVLAAPSRDVDVLVSGVTALVQTAS